MGQFKVYLNGTLLANEPLGLPEAKLTVERSETLKGVFYKYTSDLTFYGDGYDLLKAIADSDDDCQQVTCLITYQCANDRPFETLFEGIIPVGSDMMEWDNYQCQVTTGVEAADFTDLLQRYGDYKVKVQTNPGNTCIDGTTALTEITDNTTDFFSGFNGSYVSTGRHTFLFTSVLQQVLSFLTNNAVTLDADPLYSTLFQSQILELDFVDPLAPGDIIDFEFTNYYGQTYVTQKTVSVSPSLTVEFLMQEMLHAGNPTASPAYTIRTNYFEKASNVEWAAGATTITNHLPWRSWSLQVNSGAKAAGVNILQDFQYGLKNLAVTSSTLLQLQDSNMFVTLNELMRHTAQFHNMGYRLYASGAGYTFELRKIETLLNDTSTSVTLTKVPNIKYEASGDFSATTFSSPEGTADNIFRPLTWQTGYCFGKALKADGKNYSSQEIFDVLAATTETQQDDRIFYVFLKEGDPTLTELYPFRNGQSNVGSNQYGHYNIPYLGPFITARYNVNAGTKTFETIIEESPFQDATRYTCPTCPAATIQNTNTKNLRRLYTFDYPLSFSQVQDLISNALNYVAFDDGNGFSRSGFVKEVEIPFDTFVASFTLYAE